MRHFINLVISILLIFFNQNRALIRCSEGDFFFEKAALPSWDSNRQHLTSIENSDAVLSR